MAALSYMVQAWSSATGPGELLSHHLFRPASVQPEPRVVMEHVQRHWAFAVSHPRSARAGPLPRLTWAQVEAKGRPYGVFSLGAGVCVVWLGSQQHSLCHALVCEDEAPIPLCANVLQMLHAVLVEHAKSVTDTLTLKPEEALLLVERLLPAGQPLVLSAHLLKHLKRDADAAILGK